MRPSERLIHRVPSLREHIGDDARAEGFEGFVAAVMATQRANLSPAEAKYARILETFMVACVEQMNREAGRDPTPEGISTALAMWARAAGYSTIMAVASVSVPDANLRRTARFLAEEFKVGAKMAADFQADALNREEADRHG